MVWDVGLSNGFWDLGGISIWGGLVSSNIYVGEGNGESWVRYISSKVDFGANID